MGRRDRRSNRSERRQSGKVSNEEIQFPGAMGWLQKNMKWFFVAGIVLLVASLGAPIFMSALGSDPDPQAVDENASEATVTSSPTSASLDTDVITRRYQSAPPLALTEGTEYQALITLQDGDQILIDLLSEESPIYVNNFVFLASNDFFNGLTFHRVIEGFVAQGGDPDGTGTGGPGYRFQDEFDPSLVFDGPGILAMANAGPGTNGSQFFITVAPTPHLNNAHTIFGKVTSGQDVADAISKVPQGASNRPTDPVTITSIEIQES